MKITKLTLTAFRSFVATEFNVDAPRVMVTGLNGAGKSTIRESVRYLLTGKSQGLDGKGSGAEVLTPTFIGTSEVAVSAELVGIGPLERTWKPSGGGLVVKGFTGNSGVQQMALYDRLKTSEAFVQAVVDSGVFLNLEHAEAKRLILALLNVQIVIPASPTQQGLLKLQDVPYTLDELDAAYKKAYDERRVVKAQKVFIPAKPEGTFPPMAAIEKRLTELREQAQTLAGTLGATAERRRTLLLKLNHAQTVVALVPGIIQNTSETTTLPTQIADLEERLAIMEEEAAPDVHELAPVPSNLDLAGGVSVEFLRNRAEALGVHKPANGCVLDPDVRCDTPKVNFSKRAKAILAELDALPTATLPMPAALKPPSPLTELRKRLEDLKALQAKYEAATDERRRQQHELDVVTKELSALPDTAAQEAQMTELQGSILKGEGIKKGAAAYQTALQAHDTGVQQGQAHETEVARLEALCDVLGPKGARVKALADALGPFEAAVNDSTKAFGWTVKFLLDPWSVVVNDRPVETYSRSEQYRIGIALQLAIAQMSGLSFAIVDELDMLDAKNRNLIGQMLYRSPLEQILILSTREPDLALPTIKGMTCFRLGTTEGRSSITEMVGAQ